MKRTGLLISFICIILTAKSNEIANDYIVGKIYKLNGDTLIAKIHLGATSKNFIKVLYMDSFGHYLDEKNKVRGLNPNKIKGFEVMIDSIIYVFLSKNINNSGKNNKFYHLINDKYSTVKLYEFYSKKEMITGAILGGGIGAVSGAQLTDVSYMIEYNDSVLYQPKRKDFRYDKLAFILSDNKEIEKKIEDQIYKYDDIPLIIEAYNKWFAAK